MSLLQQILKRQVVNDPKMQYGVTGFFVFLGVLNLVFFGILLKVLNSRILGEIEQLNEEHKKYFLMIFNQISSITFQSLIIFGVFVLLFSFVGGIVLLQHISGPSYAFKKFLTDLLNDQKPRYPIKLRKYDFFTEQAELLNAVYEKYEIKKKETQK